MGLFFALFLIVFLLPATSYASALDDAQTAYDRKDYETARTLLQPLADHGNPEGQLMIGRMYYDGQGVKQDYAAALKWLLLAADQGNAKAQGEVGWMYERGLGTKRDDAAAILWWRKAAENGETDAQLNLGSMYMSGKGARQDLPQAWLWYSRAAEAGDANAVQALRALSAKLTPEQVAALKFIAQKKRAPPPDSSVTSLLTSMLFMGALVCFVPSFIIQRKASLQSRAFRAWLSLLIGGCVVTGLNLRGLFHIDVGSLSYLLMIIGLPGNIAGCRVSTACSMAHGVFQYQKVTGVDIGSMVKDIVNIATYAALSFAIFSAITARAERRRRKND